jgi:hypothetical protein
MMDTMDVFEYFFVVHESVGPIEIEIVENYHEYQAEDQVEDSVVR